MRDGIEFSERCSAEEGVIAAAKRCNVEDQVLSGEPNTTSSVTVPVQRASTPGITRLKVVLLGLILDGSIPIFRTVSSYIRLRLLPPSIRTLVRWNPSTIGSSTKVADPPWRMLVGWSLRSKVIGQADHGLNFGDTGSTEYTSHSARFLSFFSMWVS